MRSTPIARTLLALVVLIGLVACSSDDGAGSSTGRSQIAPSKGLLLGAWVRPDGGRSHAQLEGAVTAFEAKLGHKLAIDHFYVQQFDDPSTWLWRVKWDAAEGRTPMVSFGHGVDTRAVADGRYDKQLKAFHDALATINSPVLMRYAYEMEDPSATSWVHSPADFIAAWKHVRTAVDDPRAEWVWSPDAFSFDGKSPRAPRYWPGSSVVDWVAADGYNFYNCGADRPWKSFDRVFSSFFSIAPRYHKPLMIAEFGSREDPSVPGRKATWLFDAGKQMASTPELKAAVYFDSIGICDTRLTSSASAEQAFVAISNLPALMARPGQGL